MHLIRPSCDADLNAITAIYAHHVCHGTGTFEIEPPSLADMAQRRAEVLWRGLPYLVLVQGSEVLGFAYCNWFRPRAAYRFTGEDSIYLAPQAGGQGLGRALLGELVRQAQQAGLRKLVAVIGDSANAASIGVHRHCGFTPAGVLKGSGWKFERWLDVVLMEKDLGDAHTTPPAATIAP